MRCVEPPTEFLAYADGQLDPRTDLETIARVSAHIAQCESCRANLASHREFSQSLRAFVPYHTASDLLQARIRHAVNDAASTEAGFVARNAADSAPVNTQDRKVGRADSVRSRSSYWRVAAVAASLLLAVVSAHDVLERQSVSPFVDRSLITAHTRSLASPHLIEVASSDRHTVKPWFEGKIEFSPPVFDLANAGFPLVGGRVDTIDTRPAAALVFRRAKHTINLFVTVGNANAQAISDTAAHAASAESFAGIQIVQWRRGEFSFAAVSALNSAELLQFAALYREHDLQP